MNYDKGMYMTDEDFSILVNQSKHRNTNHWRECEVIKEAQRIFHREGSRRWRTHMVLAGMALKGGEWHDYMKDVAQAHLKGE